MLSDCKIISNFRYKGDYFKILFDAPDIAPKCLPGQFVHLKIEGMRDRLLRRPFSVNNVDKNTLQILYKCVGEGTNFMSTLTPGTFCSIMGPLGQGFTYSKDKIPVIIAGGYGAAATFMLAKNSPQKGILLAGARTSSELVLIEDYLKLQFQTFISTDDGSEGKKGLVTDILEEFVSDKKDNLPNYAFYACGPEQMLYKVARILLANKTDGEISLDHMMCCGVGACLACVIKIKKTNGGWSYSRTCKDGPVFLASKVFLD